MTGGQTGVGNQGAGAGAERQSRLAAQSFLFSDNQVMKQAEAILAEKGVVK